MQVPGRELKFSPAEKTNEDGSLYRSIVIYQQGPTLEEVKTSGFTTDLWPVKFERLSSGVYMPAASMPEILNALDNALNE